MTKLAIIIVNFNTYRFLAACFDSIYKNNSNIQLEVIVVDNASKDGSAEKIAQKFPKVKLIANKTNKGFAAANNQALKLTKAEYILFLNPDTIVEKETLPGVIDFLQQNPAVGVCTCKVKLKSGRLDDACHRGFPTPWNAFCHFSGISKIFPNSMIFDGYHLGFRNLDEIHEIDACAGAFMLIRRQAGEEVNWLDEDFFWYGEDLDFCFRVKKSGWKIMFVPYVAITHFKGVSSGIKEHSEDISTADRKTQIFATKARFDVMRIFYNKHYKDVYPHWLTSLVISAIKFKESLTLAKYK